MFTISLITDWYIGQLAKHCAELFSSAS